MSPKVLFLLKCICRLHRIPKLSATIGLIVCFFGLNVVQKERTISEHRQSQHTLKDTAGSSSSFFVPRTLRSDRKSQRDLVGWWKWRVQ